MKLLLALVGQRGAQCGQAWQVPGGWGLATGMLISLPASLFRLCPNREPSPWPIGQAQDKHWLADWCSGRRCPDSNPGVRAGRVTSATPLNLSALPFRRL